MQSGATLDGLADTGELGDNSVPEKSWKRVRAAWGDFFRWAVRDGMRLDNPVERLPKLRPTPEPVYDLWRQDELDLLVASTRKMDHPLCERLRVLTMIETGARKGELLNLTLGDFDLYRKTVTVLGKGSKRRLIPISAELARSVDEYLLTEYPILGRLPEATDHVWCGVFKVGDRVIGLKPERRLSRREASMSGGFGLSEPPGSVIESRT